MKRIDAVFLAIILIVSSFTLGANYVSSFSGTSKTMGDDFIEVDAINATKYYLDDTNITDRLGGNFTGLGAIADTLNTGQGANELYGMDQNILTTSDVSFGSVNATSEFYRGDANYTELIESLIAEGVNPFDQELNTTDNVDFHSLTVNWIDADYIDLNGENRSTWPAGGTGNALDHYAFAYLVFENSTGAYCINGSTGVIDSSDSDHDVPMNYALTNVPDWGLVIFSGDFTIDSTLVMNEFTWLIVYGQISLANSANVNMLENAHPSSNDVMCIVQGGTWFGNTDNNAAGSIIVWEHSTDPSDQSYKWVRFLDMVLCDFNDDGIYIDSLSSSSSNWEINRVLCRLGDGLSFHFYKCNDIFLTNSQSSSDGGCLFQNCGIMTIADCYFNQQINMTVCAMVYMSNCNIDMGTDTDGITLAGSYDCLLSNLLIRITLSSGFTSNSAIYLTNSDRNQIRGIQAGRFGGSGTNRWNYIIEETSTCDDNTYFDIYPDDYVTAVAKLDGNEQRLRSIYVPFSVRVNAVESMNGSVVDDASDQVGGFFNLPATLNEVVRITVDAHSNEDSPSEMHVNFTVNGGASDEAWDAESVVLANFDSTTTSFSTGDIVMWEIEPSDDADIYDFEVYHSFRFMVEYGTAASPDIATDASFRGILIEYI